MIQELLGVAYALASVLAFLFFVWGLGSAGMNGIRYSSLRSCLALSAIFSLIAVVAWKLLQ